MIDINTHEKLMLYAYNELSEDDALQVQALIATSQEVRTEWFLIQKSMNLIDQNLQSPSQNAIENILNYNKSHSDELV